MDSYKETYEKAETLLQNALRKIQDQDTEGASQDIELAAKYLKLGENETNMVQNNILYGENKNFGIIYNVFKENIDSLLETKQGRNFIKKFVNSIKKDEILKEEYNFYNMCIDASVSDKLTSEEYLNEALSVLKRFSKKDINESNQKLIDMFKANKIDEMIEIDDDTLNLYESIEYLLFNSRKMQNINEYAEKKKAVCEHIEKTSCKNKEIAFKENVDSLIKEKVDKYDNELNDDEISLLREFQENDPEKLFNSYKSDALSEIKSFLKSEEGADKDKIYKTLMMVDEMKFNPSTALEDVARFIEIQNIINE